jgi:hypothetical protein
MYLKLSGTDRHTYTIYPERLNNMFERFIQAVFITLLLYLIAGLSTTTKIHHKSVLPISAIPNSALRSASGSMN